jgi:hypothetical protein
MSRSNNSSILVLATLGVYLGLLMTGATPQVLASAAMTREFNVVDEIEVKDDLDKKPDPAEKQLDDAIEAYSKAVAEFLKNLRHVHSIEKFSPDSDTFNRTSTTFSPCPETGAGRSVSEQVHIDRWLLPVLEDADFVARRFTWLADCLPFDGFPTRNLAQSSGIKLKYDKAELVHELSIKLSSEERAKPLHLGLLAALNRVEIDGDDDDFELNKVLLKNTSLTFSSDQVFIITRLPRAGLDSLLASRAK